PGWAVNGGSTGAAEFVGCQSGFASTSGRILGALRTCVLILGGRGTILVLAIAPASTTLMGLATSPRINTLQCWYVDQDVLDCWCLPVHQKVARH
ncbi:unnamed protein product, partial [Staurois parvus]